MSVQCTVFDLNIVFVMIRSVWVAEWGQAGLLKQSFAAGKIVLHTVNSFNLFIKLSIYG